RFLQKWNMSSIITRATLRVLKTSLMVITVVPMLIKCSRIAQQSPRKQADLLPFCWAWLVEQLAFHVGEWQSIWQIYRLEKEK
ncbi:MAG TPA: hypothetical protein VD770_01120, partial [Coxiellaceae bacterium]|nr:hypothetical protein [Coxiellaceae bacterium]